MRRLAATLAAAGMLVAGCGAGNHGAASSSTATGSTASPKTPLARGALPDLMLSPNDIDTALGVTGTTSDPPFTALGEDPVRRTDYTFPAECKYTTHAGLASEYAGSGSTAVYGYHDLAPTPAGANQLESPEVYQFVVLFPSPEQASAFLSASSARWPACANRQDTVPADGTNPELRWKVGPVTNANGMLSSQVTVTVNGNGVNVTMPCQRALTARNNIVIDVDACRKDVGDLGIDIAKQIAGKVDKQ
ncbi:sensor domain-containing protein [Mycobacterium avium]|uniref:Sensor domain-containing protein n=3 Tax=Mycobacterium avium TaxID=1764 RepID=A0A3B6X984_MYCAV|nr:sensor domain-containing protein [Mycobacterium avium]ETA92981.1 nuclease PIN [Mycobacterium avium 05-4293]ETB10745.1 nuclease PIN [Mycobacterium avium subsp. avium 10-9275]ETB15483.1 nuclease PIN [Mycobacterium avium subsp. silvaticum ATCC 49884]ETB21748.1 nuclease PIN [Mycobacterium avium subsp. avium 11-4751]ETB25950.1 nuclease PIN [Mycobacterium avium 09-5983]ETB42159.1 nuclease PIN [Mycobacterium avium subsp. hominissuis 10-5606]TXA43129.1 sensor domain-containing protein [Mycobacter